MRGLKLVHLAFFQSIGESHLLQMRGLKQNYQRIIDQLNVVASFTDAWIETFPIPGISGLSGSHLLQMRGLKHFNCTAQLPISRRIFYRCVD